MEIKLPNFDRGIFIVNVLGIIYDPKTGYILIGKREHDPHISKLSWCFPGGRPAYSQELEFYLKKEIKIKTNLEVEVKNIVWAKTYPENRKFLSVYYYCEGSAGREKAGEKFRELKWIKPQEVENFFTTSIHQEILNFLESL